MITYQKRFEASLNDGLEISIYLHRMWFIKLVFCRPRGFCLAWKETINGCDVLFMMALSVFMVSAFKYYPFGGCKFNDKEIVK